MGNEEVEDLKTENIYLKRRIFDLETRLERMQKSFTRQHEEMRELRIKAGAKRVGPYKTKPILEVNKVDKSNNI